MTGQAQTIRALLVDAAEIERPEGWTAPEGWRIASVRPAPEYLHFYRVTLAKVESND